MAGPFRLLGPALALASLLALGEPASDPPAGAAPCPPSGAAVAVLSRTHELFLCRDGAPEAPRIAVALGRGGMDKRRRGDGRTPVGTYAIGDPKPSRRFRTFIPIDYPTAEQVALGFTGSGLGFHGPPRGWSDPAAARALDWTTGCIATGTDEDIDRIARFVRDHRPVAVIR